MSSSNVRRPLALSLLAGGAFALAACGGGSGSSSGSGSLTMSVTDAPVDEADNVYVQFSSVTLKPSDADEDGGDGDGEDDSGDNPAFVTFEFDQPKRIDLLEQQNGNSALLLEDEEVEAGNYDWIRLGVDLGQGETVIVIDGQQHDLEIPSGAQTGLKLVSGFTVPTGGALDLTIDFDLRKSIVEEGTGDFKLKPALRLVNDDDTGEIAVSATDTYVSANQCGTDTTKQAVYVFEGSGVAPDDVDGNDAEPVTTVQVTNEDGDDTYTGVAGFLEAGTYTVAYTCNPEDDDPEADDDLTFMDDIDIEVTAGETSDYDLPLPSDS